MNFWLKRCILLLCLISTIKNSFGQEQVEQTDSLLATRGEVYFSFEGATASQTLLQSLSIQKIKAGRVYAYANRQEFDHFKKYNLAYTLQPENFSGFLKSATYFSLDSVYPSYPEYVTMMSAFETQYGTLCKLSEIGSSVTGRKLLALKLCSPLDYSGDRPRVFLSSSIHGNELTGYMLMLKLVDYMLKNYGSDPLVTKILDETELWINPLANPDGTYYGGNKTVLGSRRYNQNSVDLNRNFPDPVAGRHPDGNDWQPETTAMIQFYEDHAFHLSVNFHTGVEVVNYPWDTWAKVHPDDTWYQMISRQYADSAILASSNTYMNSSEDNFVNGIVNGYAWYRITGGRQDYFNYFEKGREVTIELSEAGLPDSATIEKYWKYNRVSMLRYIEQSLFGIKGTVTDVETGAPLVATIRVVDHDMDSTTIRSSSGSGVFYRFLSPGYYHLRVSATGYQTADLENVQVGFRTLTTENIALRKLQNRGVAPNPCHTLTYITLDSSWEAGDFKVELFDLSGKKLMTNTVYFTPGVPVALDLTFVEKGMYLIRLSSGKEKKTFRIVKE